MFPGCFYLIGMWYRRHEAQKRFTFFFSSTTLAGAFGGLLAAAIGKMDGLQGYAGWRWIFILEGSLTVLVSFIFFFLLPNFPEQVKWLSEEEKNYVSARLQIDQGKSAVERKITIKDIGNVFKDYKVVVAGFMYFGLIVPAYGYAYFSPGIIQGYGYSKIQTQLHSVPPWAAAFGFAMLMATISDYTKHRFAYAIFSICVAIAGFGILIAVHDNRNLQYGALFMVTMGTYTAMPIIVCWFNMNLGGYVSPIILRLAGSANSLQASQTLRWICVANWFRKHRRHHCYLCVPQERRSKVHSGIQHLYCLHYLGHHRMCHLWLWLLGREQEEG